MHSYRVYDIDHGNENMQCGKKCLGDTSCASGCLVQSIPQLSNSCADCFGADVHCTAVNCIKQCIFSPSGASCLKCNADVCTPGLVKCSAVNANDLPQ